VTREQNFKLQDMNKNLEEKVRDRTKQLDGKNTELRTAYIQTIRALAEAIDAKDAYTRGHSERVAVYASRIGNHMGLRKELIERIYFAGLLHDVGKIAVPDNILRKPGALTSDEWQTMRRHPAAGYEILLKIDFLKTASQIVMSHHERYDGGGYPRGLAGEEIPLGARIFTIADAFDAMTTDRPYQKARQTWEALEIIEKGKGKHFDPQIVDAFASVMRRRPQGVVRVEQEETKLI